MLAYGPTLLTYWSKRLNPVVTSTAQAETYALQRWIEEKQWISDMLEQMRSLPRDRSRCCATTTQRSQMLTATLTRLARNTTELLNTLFAKIKKTERSTSHVWTQPTTPPTSSPSPCLSRSSTSTAERSWVINDIRTPSSLPLHRNGRQGAVLRRARCKPKEVKSERRRRTDGAADLWGECEKSYNSASPLRLVEPCLWEAPRHRSLTESWVLRGPAG